MQLPSWCSAGTGFQDYMASFEFIKAFGCAASDLGGGFATVSTLVLGGVVLGIYTRTGSFALPTVLLLLTGGVVITTLAAPAIQMVTILIFTLIAGVITYAIWRFAR